MDKLVVVTIFYKEGQFIVVTGNGTIRRDSFSELCELLRVQFKVDEGGE